MRHRCVGFDRVIDSDVAIRGALPFDAADDAAGDDGAIRLRWQEAARVPDGPLPLWSIAEDALCFAPPGVAHYRCTASAIDVRPCAAGARDMIDALLIATALPALLWLQGGLMLHAAAVVPRGAAGALAITGRSGAGKSRLAAALLARGGALVADDSIVVEPAGEGFGCAGLAGGYHLGAAAEQARCFHPVPRDRARRRAALGAIVVLDDGVGASGPARMATIDALQAVLRHRHRPNVPRLCGLEPGLLDRAVRLARSVPVYRWPRGDADALLDEARCASLLRGTPVG